MKELGLSHKLLSSVADVMKTSAQQRVEETQKQSDKLNNHYGKLGAAKPLSVEETKVAAEQARAPQKRVYDTITQMYTKSLTEAKVTEPKAEEPASKDLKKASVTDPYSKPTLKARKAKMQADVSDSVELDGETITEKEGTIPKTPREKDLAAKADPKNKITHKDVMVARGVTKEEKDTPGNSYEHQCAIHVKHAKLGEGRTLHSQHAEPDEDGNIAWYDVLFAEGIEKQVPTSELEILVSESHMNHKRKMRKEEVEQVSEMGNKLDQIRQQAKKKVQANAAAFNSMSPEQKEKTKKLSSMAKKVAEEVEQLDELSPETEHSYFKKAFAQKQSKTIPPEKKKQRQKGLDTAGKRIGDRSKARLSDANHGGGDWYKQGRYMGDSVEMADGNMLTAEEIARLEQIAKDFDSKAQ